MLSNKIAIVTGGGQGIGRAIALDFAKANAQVVVAEINPETGNRTVGEVKKLNKTAIYSGVDVTKADQVAKLVQDTLNAFGRIDVLVNNAGGGYSVKSVMEMPEDEWDRVITLNVKGTFLCSRDIGIEMVKQRAGSIINLASLAGLQPFPLRSHYAAAKAAIVNFTRTMAIEMGPLNVRVNAIAPGQINTPLLEGIHAKHPGLREERISRLPMGRFGEPEDVAKAALFLASDLSSYVTGEIIGVNGGLDSEVTARELAEIRSKFEAAGDKVK
jgi:3-oxoacyl-[acyl-carrier protein] reductase